MHEIVHINQNLPSSEFPTNYDELINAYLADAQVRNNSKTRYKPALKLYFDWLTKKKYELKNITLTELLIYKKETGELVGSDGKLLSRMTVGFRVIAIKAFYNWCESKFLMPNPGKFLKSPPSENKFQKKPLSPEQCTRLLDYFKSTGSHRNFAIANLMLRCGLRTVEVIRADCGDIEVRGESRILWVHGKGRNSKDKWVELRPKAYEPIAEYWKIRNDDAKTTPMFTSESVVGPGGRLIPGTISELIKVGLRAIGLNDPSISAHSLRHSTGTNMMRMGATQKDVQNTLRHAKESTTEGYVATLKDENRLKKSAESLLDDLF